ncbi:tetraspanin [Holotrichia oblita]|uniref:Tetraspanin n=2 Tax=Holotrichia oblita TaxID=644536 RepID=A0ACB9T926_HOLOL|nr:tetraspanin [Holotrichia oblita]KAI4463367.1 tetraspanin [Holotrichia oblita]
MYASIRSYGNYEHPAVTQSWDETQRRLMCCGVRGPHDWSDHIPDSCCRESVPGRSQRCQIVVQQNALIMYKDGCLFVTKRFVKDHAVIIGSAGVVVACLMVNLILKIKAVKYFQILWTFWVGKVGNKIHIRLK